MNKTVIIAILSLFLIGFLLGTQLSGCHGSAGTGSVKPLHSDTVIRFIDRIDTEWHQIELVNDIPYTVWGHDTVYVRKTERVSGRDTSWITQYIAMTDTVAYADTLRQAGAFKAEIFDTLAQNRIIGRSLRWANLSPLEVKTVTNTVLKKSPLVKVFVGADAYGGYTASKINIDLAPGASLVFADRYMVDLGYFIFHQEISAGLKVKLSFKK
jgi:hypothetical protein